MSVNVETRVVGPGSDERLDDAWELKETIRGAEGVLKQRHGFFADAYRRSTVHLLVDADDNLAGFAAVRRDGYILFLAVDPAYRGEGFGKRLVATVADEHDSVTCHARATNDNALQFYESLGFEIKRRIDTYYEDGGDAYYLKLGDDAGLASKLSDLVRRR
ncbi:Ribosomal protein S18 acetylase RimI [Natronoarchaeum philippinense]|uniref:Ribosomal protein S18 acetylase RimI n=1 Tax=Natronoarchaeum philippinense TaxID=558529 RepID=A0A285N6G4_NATPI|nr:N-acetyltransferase [Natronoarchaeum philippinense]SNZ04898.1 Ribosomal protein S18 acetylase RimI [Natronoarchaeum philippinense]